MLLGKVLAELTADAISGGSVLGLQTFGNTLVIPDNNNKRLLFYDIKF